MGMWKDSYAVGHDLIDSQHRELFRMTDDLAAAVRRKGPDGPRVCADAVAFLKDYVVKHFADEEALQAALGFEGLAAHRLLHRDFVATVLEYEKKLIDSDYNAVITQQFAGKLIGWLIYHVVGEDRKITGMVAAAPRIRDEARPADLIAYFTESAGEVLGQMLNTAVQAVPDTPQPVSEIGDISVSIGLVGDRPGRAEFVFPLVTALRVVQSMTMMELDDMGDMMDSALREITNIISGNAASKIAEAGGTCDITTPTLYRGQRPVPDSGRVMKSDFGSFVIFLNDTA